MPMKTFRMVVGTLLLFIGVVGSGVSAQEEAGASYTLHAGLSGQGSVRFLSFIPSTIQVHRGDMITWVFGGGLHNVRFTQEVAWSPFFTPIEVDGTPHLIMDPRLAFRTVDSGGTFTGEPLNSGVAFDMDHSEHLFDAEAPYSYSIVIDAAPGTYTYLCDLHPGMIGYIEVVHDDVEIPSPLEVSEQISSAVATALDAATEQIYALEAEYATTTDDGNLEIAAGIEFINGEVRVAIDRFYPSTGVIQAGESVTWMLDEDATVAHAIVAPFLGLDAYSNPLEDDQGNTQIEFSPLALMTTLTDGLWDNDADYVNAGLVAPGQSLTVTFPEPGVYQYSDVFEPGMTGTIVVLDAE
jgi:plastocyanin